MRKVYRWLKGLSCQTKSSLAISASILSGASIVLTILGVSLGSLEKVHVLIRFCIVLAAFAVLAVVAYFAIGSVFKESISLAIRGTQVTIRRGDIFEAPSLRVIACDDHFDTRIDDVIIARKSLHGQLVVQHGNKQAIESLVESEARRRGIQRDPDGRYKFPLGTIIEYRSEVDDNIYLMVAMNELDDQNKAYTTLAKYEQMLMKMWEELDRVYAMRDIAIPILGDGITRFQDGPQGKENLIRCMLCTLNSSSAALKSKIEILIYDDIEDVSLYEFRNLFPPTPTRKQEAGRTA